MVRPLQVTGLVAILTVFGIATAGAQTFGRIELTVLDAAGEAVPDVDVTVTCDDLRNFYKELKTNEKGKATITLGDATKRYNFHLVHPEHGEIKQTLKPAIRETKRVELAFTDTDRPDGVVDDGPRYSKAELVFNEGVSAESAGNINCSCNALLIVSNALPNRAVGSSSDSSDTAA